MIDQLKTVPPDDLLKMHRTSATVLFTDLRSFTSITEQIEPDALQELVNSFLFNVVEQADRFKGTIEGFMGDGAMVIFNAPVATRDHPLRALHCATEMMEAHERWILDRHALNLPAPKMGIGLTTGPAIAGNIGTPGRMQYTALGRTTNLAARLCGEALGGQVLISRELHEAAMAVAANYEGPTKLPRLGFQSLGPRRFKNVRELVEVVAVKSRGASQNQRPRSAAP